MPNLPREWIRFPNAPIQEAVLDVRAELPSVVDIKRLAEYHEKIRDHYPQKVERMRWEAQFGISKDATQPSISPKEHVVDGFLFRSSDGKDIVQARLDGFTVNRRHPYGEWRTLRDEAKRLWEYYLAIATPMSVTRLALRYINRIQLPLPFKDFKEYILTTPEIAPSLPQGLRTFFMRLEIPDDRYEALAIVTETIEPASNNLLPLIFDIDVIRQAQFQPASPKIWETFEQLRELKNEIFFNSLTDKAKELFQ